ncbi:MAG: hypothetical protein ACOC2M_02845, partial [bacterium]
MTDYEKFQNYKKIKKELVSTYRGYPVEKIMALDVIVKVYFKRQFTVKSLMAYILKYQLPLFFSSLNLEQLKFQEPGKTLFSMGVFKRKDFYEIMDYAKSHVKNHLEIDFSKLRYRRKINLRNIFRALKIINKTKRLG